MQVPPRKQSHLFYAPRLFDGMENVLHFANKIGPNSADSAVLVETLESLVPETPDAHICIVRLNRTYGQMILHPLRSAADGDDAGARNFDQAERQHQLPKLSILSLAPVISNTKLSLVASMTRARNASASRNASMRCSPLPRT